MTAIVISFGAGNADDVDDVVAVEDRRLARLVDLGDELLEVWERDVRETESGEERVAEPSTRGASANVRPSLVM